MLATLPRASREQLQERIRPLLHRADENGCSGLILVDSLNQFWASGYNVNRDAANWERPCALVFSLAGEPVFLLNEICMPHAYLAVELGWCWVDDIYFYAEHPQVDNRLASVRDWGRLLRQILTSHQLAGKRLACDKPGFCRYWMGRDADAAELIDASAWVEHARMLKDEVEITTLRAACALSDEAMHDFTELIRPGEVAMEVAWEIQKRLFTEAARRYPDARVEGRVTASTGLDTACVNGPYAFAGRRFAPSDCVVTIVKLFLNGYAAENERTFLVEHCPKDKETFFQTAVDAQAAGRDAARVGNRICDIDGAAQAVIERADMGQYILHRTGHGMGLDGHEPPGDMSYNTDQLEHGMIFTVEPGIYVPGVGGFRHSDTVLIGQTPESLTQFGRSLDDCVVTS